MADKQVVQCENGHFYDAEKFNSCPHCGKIDNVKKNDISNTKELHNENEEKQQSQITKEKKGFWEKVIPAGKHKNEVVKCENGHFYSKGEFEKCPYCQEQDRKKEVESKYKPEKDYKTVMVPFEDNVEETIPKDIPQAPVNSEYQYKPIETSPEVMIKPQEPVPEKGNSETSRGNDIDSNVVNSEKNNAGKNIFDGLMMDDNKKTVLHFGNEEKEPVTGWLVCVNGDNYGVSYPICAGNNKIGRAANMDIVLEDESSVSREDQARIMFEPKKQIFIIWPGTAKALTYVNDEILLDHLQLQPYDKITFGEADYMFVPFCGERFDWKNYPYEG